MSADSPAGQPDVVAIADALAELMGSEYAKLDALRQRILVNRLKECLECLAPSPPPAPRPHERPMNDAEVAAFNRQVLAFGKHKGKRYGEVPLDYLEWLADQKIAEWRELHRYLRSQKVGRQRQALEPDEDERRDGWASRKDLI